MLEFNAPQFEDIQLAYQTIRPQLVNTPVLRNEKLNKVAGCNLYFKCENLQHVGAFKFRGACFAVSLLSEEQKRSGVFTVSSGNHGAALARAGRDAGVSVIVGMPRNAPESKKSNVAYYGAEIVEFEPGMKARMAFVANMQSQTDKEYIAPYDDTRIVTGQGTIAIEMLEQVSDIQAIVAPLGGGGLLSGCAIAMRGFNPGIQVFGAEPKGADDAFQSFRQGKIIECERPNSICDGLLGTVGNLPFSIIQQYVDDIYTVSDEDVIEALKLIWQHLKIIVEPSSAIALAAILQNKSEFTGKNVAVILTGGNVDFKKVKEWF